MLNKKPKPLFHNSILSNSYNLKSDPVSLKYNSKINALATAKLNTVAVRFPKHKIIRTILKEIDLELAKTALHSIVQNIDVEVNIDYIQKYVSNYFDVTIELLKAKTRKREIVVARQVAMYLAKDLTNHSLPEIGDAFGGRDHTTVLHAVRKIKELLETSADIKEDVKNLLRILTT